MMHHHMPIKKERRVVPYQVCTNELNCDEAAHGNITEIDHCRCGAVRRTNINQHYRESSGWRKAE